MKGLGSLSLRAACGGLLMGLANLVPGISGGTMLLATGIYAAFIEAIAEISTLRFRAGSIALLVVVGLTAILTIGLLAGPVKHLVETQTWIMYSLFIGLTLGGVPIVWRRARPGGGAVWTGAVVGFVLMAVLAFTRGEGQGSGWPLLFVAGVAGASAMILPGVSGAYLLLVLGQYETILGAIKQVKARDFDGAWQVLLPVGLGVAVGILVVSNVIKWALHRHEKSTLGVLLGLLVGSVLGIWPFQAAVEPLAPRAFFTPDMMQIGGALGLIAVGFMTTVAIDRLGK